MQDTREMIVAAALLGHVNLGLPAPEKQRLSVLVLDSGSLSLPRAVADISGNLIESEAMYDMFIEEAESWLTQCRKNGMDQMRLWHGNVLDLMPDPEQV